jgi:hypothetical protein
VNSAKSTKIEWTVPRSRKRWTATLNYKEMTTRGGEAVCLCHLMLRGANPRPTSRWLGHVSWAGAQVSSPRFHLLFLQNIGEVYWLINNEKTIISSYFFIFKKLSPMKIIFFIKKNICWRLWFGCQKGKICVRNLLAALPDRKLSPFLFPTYWRL